jgi:hypothetical protein
MEEPLNCPFCGAKGEFAPKSYSDGESTVRCSNERCHSRPAVSVRAKSHPNNLSISIFDLNQTFHYDYEKSDAEAMELWNFRRN